MKKFSLIVLLLLCSFGKAQTLQEDLETIVTDFELMGLSLWVSTPNNEETFAFGFRDFDRNLTLNEATKFRIASISKAVTALGLIKLLDQGFFQLDDDVSTTLGYTLRNPQFPDTPITFRMLLSHQSSLQDGSGYTNFLTATYNTTPIPNINELLLPDGAYFTNNMWRTETPGTYFTYSNINFGVIGTLIERLSNQRFDVFMKTEILEPLGITGSFNIQDLDDINNLSVLYRYQGGWNPQWDNYQGIMPSPPDLSGYTIGTNGVYFSPQGGLRASASELGSFISFLKNNGGGSNLSISENTLELMKAIAWNYTGSNGDNYFGLFNRWGLGLHHANVTDGDQICNLNNYGSFLGHPGEAYGLISDAYFGTNEAIQFSFLINGIRNGYTPGNQSSFYTIEESIFSVLCRYFEENLSVNNSLENTIKIYPNPTKNILNIEIFYKGKTQLRLFNIKGQQLLENEMNSTSLQWDISALSSGLYFLKIQQNLDEIVHKIVIQ